MKSAFFRSHIMRNSRGTLHSVCTLHAAHGPGLRYTAFLQGCPHSCTPCVGPQWRAQGGKLVEAAALVRQAARYRPYFGQTGGMTLTGAEPLAQVEFCLEVAKAARQQGIHLCLETSAYRWDTQVRELYEKVNLVLLRFHLLERNGKERLHRQTGALRDTLAYFAAAGTPLWIRHIAQDTQQVPWDTEALHILRQEVTADRHGPPIYTEDLG